MFKWLFSKKTPVYECDNPACLHEVTTKAREVISTTNRWSQEKIEKFYTNKFLPAANKAAKNGISYIDLLDKNMLLFEKMEVLYQVRDYIKSKNYTCYNNFTMYW